VVQAEVEAQGEEDSGEEVRVVVDLEDHFEPVI
jgi:hypothetical protein